MLFTIIWLLIGLVDAIVVFRFAAKVAPSNRALHSVVLVLTTLLGPIAVLASLLIFGPEKYFNMYKFNVDTDKKT